MVNFQKLSFSWPNSLTPLYENVNFVAKTGKITSIIGPSGAGKTTFLRFITGALQPDRGSVLVQGYDLAKLNRKELYRERKKIGMLFQSGGLFSEMNLFENVAFPLREHTNLNESLIRSIVLIKLDLVGLRNARRLMPQELSGGMSRRAALARAMVLDPPLALYDEPFAGQDPISKAVLSEIISKLNWALGVTTILVSHDIREVLKISDYVYFVAMGKITSHGSPKELVHEASGSTKQFLSGSVEGPVSFHFPGVSLERDLLIGTDD